MSLYRLTFHVTPVDLCINFQCNLYMSCIMSCGNKIVSNCFQIVSNLPTADEQSIVASPNSIVIAIVNSDAYHQSPLMDKKERCYMRRSVHR